MVYEVRITETLSRVVKVMADSAEEAERLVEEKYNDEKIVLDASDWEDTDIGVAEKAENEENIDFYN